MKYLSLLIIFFSINSFAITCADDDIDLNPGDVISADMIKDIFDRISGVSRGMTANELSGVWSCKTVVTDRGTSNGFSLESDGIGSSMTQDVTFTQQSNDSFIITYQNKMGQPNFAEAGPESCKAKLIDGAKIAVVSDGTCHIAGVHDLRRISGMCFSWEIPMGTPVSSVTCQKKALIPLAPKDLTATLSVSGTGGAVSLSWTAGDSNTDSYTIKAKTSNTGAYSDVTTELSGTTYTDTLSSGTKWYRVYGVNASGTSTGSNVVSVIYSSE